MTPVGCVLSLLVALTGCDTVYYVNSYSDCYNPEKKDFDCCDPDTPRDHPACTGDAGADGEADAGTDGDVDADADDGGPHAAVCPWPCTSVGGGGFNPFPSYVWIEGEAPPPQPLKGIPWTSWIGVEFAEPNCPTCSCVAPTLPEDGCVLPSTWSAESTACGDASAPNITSFDPLLDWTGSCTSTNPIAGGMLCDGAPCVKSLVVQPPAIQPCIADPAMPPEGQTLPSPKRTMVIEYVAAATSGTCDETTNCIAPPPEGYKLCFVADDLQAEAECPAGWTDRFTGWRDVTDGRACSACTCGAPEGAYCEVRAKVYSDDVCGNERGSLVVSSSEGAKCVDLLEGTALGSKTAEVLAYQAGTCAPSTSEVLGEIVTDRAVTYCCIPAAPVPG
jgi:hypothetical protein